MEYARPSREFSVNELLHVRRQWLPEELAPRISPLLISDLIILSDHYGIYPAEILKSIMHLETGETGPGAKRSAPFKSPLLTGLWHKHYFTAHFVVANLNNALAGENMRKVIERYTRKSGNMFIDTEFIRGLAGQLTEVTLENRHRAKKLTGEWIVYLPTPQGRYYLYLATHRDPEAAIAHKSRFGAQLLGFNAW